jgi:hypothetical protein
LYEVRPPLDSEEPWARYLSFKELGELRAARDRVRDLGLCFSVGQDTSDLKAAQFDLTLCVAAMRSRAMERFSNATCEAGDDPSALWKTVRNFRLDPEAAQGLPVDALCAHFSSLFNRPSDCLSLPFLMLGFL